MAASPVPDLDSSLESNCLVIDEQPLSAAANSCELSFEKVNTETSHCVDSAQVPEFDDHNYITSSVLPSFSAILPSVSSASVSSFSASHIQQSKIHGAYDYPALSSFPFMNGPVNQDTFLNQAFVQDDPLQFTDVESVKDTGKWYKIPDQPVCNLNNNHVNNEHSFVMDSILSMEHDLNPRHSTPARRTNYEYQSHIFIDSKMSPLVNTHDERPSTAGSGQTTAPSENNKNGKSKKRVNIKCVDRPPYTYTAMAVMAIYYSSKVGLTSQELRDSLAMMFPFFRSEYKGWKSSLRHMLSNSKVFFKIDPSDYKNSPIWCVDYSHVTTSMFAKQRRGNYNKVYKDYLHEELGLPPVNIDAVSDKKGLSLPPKPCFNTESDLSVGVNADEDFLCARKESPATPAPSVASTTSDLDDIPMGPPAKRRKADYHPMTSIPVTTDVQKQTQIVEPTLKTTSNDTQHLSASSTLSLNPYNSNSQFNHQYYGHNSHFGHQYSRQAAVLPYNNYPPFYDFRPTPSQPLYDRMMNPMWLTNAYYQGYGAADMAYWARYSGQMMNDNTYQAPLNLSKPVEKDIL